jgi:hypothetical protein
MTEQQKQYYYTVGVATYPFFINKWRIGRVKILACDTPTLTVERALSLLAKKGEYWDSITSLASISEAQYECLAEEEQLNDEGNGSIMPPPFFAIGILAGLLAIVYSLMHLSQ